LQTQDLVELSAMVLVCGLLQILFIQKETKIKDDSANKLLATIGSD
jgi:hypothetical protein